MRQRLEVGVGNRWGWVVACSCILIVLFFPAKPRAHAEPSTSFPVPKVLRPNIAFWKRIFTVLDGRRGMLHDSTDVTLVYHTYQDLPEDAQQRQRLVDRYRRYYQRILLRLAHGKRRGLSREEARVLALFKGRQQSKVLRAAAYDIRFQQGLRDRFLQGLTRSGAYMPTIRRIFAAAGLPTELGLLPHVESSFNHEAYSKSGAAGMWQFTRGTGRRFLHIDRTIDERFDFRRATVAAAQLLQENYQELGTWPLAITAYNHGVNGMKQAIAKLRTREFGTIVQHYRSRSFGFASKNFYAEFLAVLDIVSHLDTYFQDIEFDKPQAHHSLTLDAHVSLRTVAKYLGVEPEEVARWNPALRRPILRGQRLIPKDFVLYIPHQRLGPDETRKRWASIPAAEKFAHQLHGGEYRVRPGDTLSSIAQHFRTSVETLMDLNPIDRPDHITAGRLLRLPRQTRYRAVARRPMPKARPQAVRNQRASEAPVFASSLVSAATDTSHPAFHLLMAEFPSHDLQTPDTEAWLQVQDGTIRVVATETLSRYATWLDIPVQRLLRLNRLSHQYKLPLGTRVRLDFSRVSQHLFSKRRLQYHRHIEEKFFHTYVVDGVITHTLKPGETLWRLAHHEYDVPLWLLQKYNHDLEFHALLPGTKLRIPQVVERNAS